MEKKYDLSEFEMNKALLKRNMNNSAYYIQAFRDLYNGNLDDINSKNAILIIKLMERRTTKYTLEELFELSSLMSSSSQEMYVDNPEDFLPMVVANAQKSIDKQQRIEKRIKYLIKEEESEPIKSGDVHVRINDYYIATVRNIGSFKKYLKEQSDVDKFLLGIVATNNNPPEEFVDEVQNIIDNYKKAYKDGGNVNAFNYTVGGL
jgi:hypothetical protein